MNRSKILLFFIICFIISLIGDIYYKTNEKIKKLENELIYKTEENRGLNCRINNLENELNDYIGKYLSQKNKTDQLSSLVDDYNNLQNFGKRQLTLYDIPLSDELQLYNFQICEKYNIDYKLVLALMYVESGFNPNAISKTNDYGLCQINRSNHKWLSKELGITNFLDPRQNIHAGVYILSLASKNGRSLHHILMSYNLGEGGANKKIKSGIKSTEYSEKILYIGSNKFF